MDQYLSAVIIALITGIGSIITLVIQKKSDKVVHKIDEQNMFIEREKEIKFKLNQKQKEKEAIIHEIMILILDTNLFIIPDVYMNEKNLVSIDEISDKAKLLKNKFNSLCEEIEDIQKEYDLLLDMSSDFQREIEKVTTTSS